MKPFLFEDGWIYFIAYDRQLKLLATTIFDNMYCAETKDRMKSVWGGINMVRFSDLAILQTCNLMQLPSPSAVSE